MPEEVNYYIIRKKVKHIRISIENEREVKIVIPIRYPISELGKVIEKKRNWINNKLIHYNNLKNNLFKLSENEILYLNGKYLFVLKPELKNSVKINPVEKKIYSGVNLLNKKIQNHWLKLEAKRIIEERIRLINRAGKYKYKKIFIRGQKTKWGNCSSRKNISFNWRLIKAPLFVIDYLIAHELTHLEEMNHSKNFWNKLALLYPEYKIPYKWLKQNGIALFY